MVRPGRVLSLIGVSLVEMRVRVDGMREVRRWDVRPSSMGRGRVVGIFASELWVNYDANARRSRATHGQVPLKDESG
jgi:hypothetical protein